MKRFLIPLLAASVWLQGQMIDQRLRRAQELIRSGSYADARLELTELLGHLELAGPAPLLLTVLNNLAGIHADTENYREAERLYLRSLRISGQLAPANPPSRLSIQQNLLVLYLQAGWLGKAERLAGQVHGEFTQADPKQRLQFLDCLGSLSRARKRFDEAEGYYREALALAQATGETGVSGFLLNSLGLVHAGRRKMKAAANAFEQAVASHEAAHGKQHPVLITSLTNLASAYLASHRLREAQSTVERAGALLELTPNASQLLLYRLLLLESKALGRLHRKAEARQARQRADDIRQRSGSRFPDGFTVEIDDLRRR